MYIDLLGDGKGWCDVVGLLCPQVLLHRGEIKQLCIWLHGGTDSHIILRFFIIHCSMLQLLMGGDTKSPDL